MTGDERFSPRLEAFPSGFYVFKLFFFVSDVRVSECVEVIKQRKELRAGVLFEPTPDRSEQSWVWFRIFLGVLEAEYEEPRWHERAPVDEQSLERACALSKKLRVLSAGKLRLKKIFLRRGLCRHVV